MLGESDLLSIIQTKLHRPQMPSGHLHRQQLVDRLNLNLYRPLTLISAPAGYGKSTLAACWVDGCDIPAAWISLDKKDNDIRRFISYFIASVRSVFPDACEELGAIASATEIESMPAVAHTLLNELDKVDGRFILVLDDYQFIHEKGVNALLAELLAHPSRNMHLVIATRRDPNLPLSALRAKGLLTEIRIQDLRLSLPAIGKYLKQSLKVEIDDKLVAAIEQRTEGWVTGLRLAVVYLRHQQDQRLMRWWRHGNRRQPSRLYPCRMSIRTIDPAAIEWWHPATAIMRSEPGTARGSNVAMGLNVLLP